MTMWVINTEQPVDSPFTFRILPGAIKTIGRAPRADFRVDAALVSRVHCRLTAMPDGTLEVHDLQSTNGTFVNGARVETGRLSPGDRLGIGRVEMVALKDAD
jgi:pSer/pThr/pTyr-binding forkhead associated (FHA) protein